MRVSVMQKDLLTTTKGTKIVLILEVLEGHKEAEAIKANEQYNICMLKI